MKRWQIDRVRLTGWQRLWLCLLGVWAIIVVAAGALNWPTPPEQLAQLRNPTTDGSAASAASEIDSQPLNESALAASGSKYLGTDPNAGNSLFTLSGVNQQPVEAHLADGTTRQFPANTSIETIQAAMTREIAKRPHVVAHGESNKPLSVVSSVPDPPLYVVSSEPLPRSFYQRHPVAVLAGIWAVPPLILALCGAAIAWVRRGFAQDRAERSASS